MATGTSDDERDDDLTNTSKPVGDEVDAPKSASAKNAKKSKTPKAPKKPNGERRSVGKFFHEVLLELKKVVTPTRQELWRYVGVVIAFLIIMMLLVLVLDWLFSFGSSWTFGNGRPLFPDSWFQGPAQTPVPTESLAPTATATPTATP